MLQFILVANVKKDKERETILWVKMLHKLSIKITINIVLFLLSIAKLERHVH